VSKAVTGREGSSAAHPTVSDLLRLSPTDPVHFFGKCTRLMTADKPLGDLPYVRQ
jgi:hypothetical protein